ncbi:DegT/DnrJ/EryC1/StrS family aminotransferase [Pedobacter alpinus]|uniref:DegT/DnrJ/EryC1/StrS family aminotransferase n=1 Tax=Pedobacter alpinus TaxID=1590643 RepID=A0ABW5TP72_9SPHI
MIPVTKPFLPPIAEYQKYIETIWQRNWLTNNGPLVNELELNLKEYLDVPHLLYLSNGTIALQIAIKALALKGEIITTPFSYVATTSSIVWEGCKPVFADIDEKTLNIDPLKIEAAITPNTSAILATHVYGNPCDIDAIDKIAKKHNLKVIYDAAHCFGTKYKGKSVFNYGDISTTSFHATKLFHTTEGGAVFTQNADLLKKIAYLRNFGHHGPEEFAEVGINGKNSEFHAAMGLANLPFIDKILASRQQISIYYMEALKGLDVHLIELNQDADFNYAYFPIIFKNEDSLLKALSLLNQNWIYPRRYFYPSLNDLHYVEKTATPITDKICRRVLCLPLYYGLSTEEVDFIARLLLRAQNN